MPSTSRYTIHALDRRIVCLLALVVLSFVLRASRTDLMEFKHDEAVAWLRATALVEGVEFPLAGLVTSKGLENFPLFLYCLALFQTVFHEPPQLVWPIALLICLAILFIFNGIRALLDERAAWLTVLFYAFSPSAIFFSRKLWAQDLIPFWTSTIFYLATVLLVDKPSKHNNRHVALLYVLLVTSCQIHFAATFLVVAYVAAIFIYRLSTRPRPIAIGVLTGMIPALPYVYYQIINHGTGFKDLLNHTNSFTRIRLKEALFFFIRQPVDEGLYGMLGPDYHFFLQTLPGYAMLRYFLSAMVIGGFLMVLVRFIRGDHEAKRRLGFILILTITPLLLIVLSRIPLVPSYFLILCPLPFLLVALPFQFGLEWLHKHFAPITANILLGLFMLYILTAQVRYVAVFLRKIDREGGAHGDYGASYATLHEAADRLPLNRQALEIQPTEDLHIIALIVIRQGNTEGSPPHESHSAQEPSQEEARTRPFLTQLQRNEAEKAKLLALRLIQSP